MTTPFLEKLRNLCISCPVEVASWGRDGSAFEVHSNDKFNKLLKGYFKGSSRTFVRQLHFYGFSKRDCLERGTWEFQHPEFSRGNLNGVFKITRKTRNRQLHFATKDELSRLQGDMQDLKEDFDGEIAALNDQLDQLLESVHEVLVEQGRSAT